MQAIPSPLPQGVQPNLLCKRVFSSATTTMAESKRTIERRSVNNKEFLTYSVWNQYQICWFRRGIQCSTCRTLLILEISFNKKSTERKPNSMLTRVEYSTEFWYVFCKIRVEWSILRSAYHTNQAYFLFKHIVLSQNTRLLSKFYDKASIRNIFICQTRFMPLFCFAKRHARNNTVIHTFMHKPTASPKYIISLG